MILELKNMDHTTKSDSRRRFLTPKEFMLANDLARTTVYDGIRDGSILSIRISKRKMLIPEDALERKLFE